jgi:Transposase IS116/IS110/IS902 family
LTCPGSASGAARLLIEVGDITRFPNRVHCASWNGTAPIDASSGDHVRHRLSRAGTLQINRVLHIMATVQLRNHIEDRAYFDVFKPRSRRPGHRRETWVHQITEGLAADRGKRHRVGRVRGGRRSRVRSARGCATAPPAALKGGWRRTWRPPASRTWRTWRTWPRLSRVVTASPPEPVRRRCGRRPSGPTHGGGRAARRGPVSRIGPSSP